MNDRAARITASKRLSRYKLNISDNLMQCEIIWCRTAYAENEHHSRTKDNQHTFYELHYVLEGEMPTGLPDGKDLSVTSGHFVLYPPYVRHYTEASDPRLEKLVCGLTIDGESDLVRGALECAATDDIVIFEASPQMKVYVDLMLTNAIESKAANSTVISRLLECLLIEVFRCMLPDSCESDGDRKVFDKDLRIREVHSFIDNNVGTQISSEDVARHLNISLRHLNRLTNEYNGMSVSRLIAQRKLEYVKSLLLRPELGLKDIADMSGFASEYTLNRFFKNHEGMAIGIYRRSMRV